MPPLPPLKSLKGRKGVGERPTRAEAEGLKDRYVPLGEYHTNLVSTMCDSSPALERPCHIAGLEAIKAYRDREIPPFTAVRTEQQQQERDAHQQEQHKRKRRMSEQPGVYWGQVVKRFASDAPSWPLHDKYKEATDALSFAAPLPPIPEEDPNAANGSYENGRRNRANTIEKLDSCPSIERPSLTPETMREERVEGLTSAFASITCKASSIKEMELAEKIAENTQQGGYRFVDIERENRADMPLHIKKRLERVRGLNKMCKIKSKQAKSLNFWLHKKWKRTPADWLDYCLRNGLTRTKLGRLRRFLGFEVVPDPKDVFGPLCDLQKKLREQGFFRPCSKLVGEVAKKLKEKDKEGRGECFTAFTVNPADYIRLLMEDEWGREYFSTNADLSEEGVIGQEWVVSIDGSSGSGLADGCACSGKHSTDCYRWVCKGSVGPWRWPSWIKEVWPDLLHLAMRAAEFICIRRFHTTMWRSACMCQECRQGGGSSASEAELNAEEGDEIPPPCEEEEEAKRKEGEETKKAKIQPLCRHECNCPLEPNEEGKQCGRKVLYEMNSL
uniref:Uncharacterized protein n=1 Tax=Chromera velia CCMP2878 TaxID=1169474 RepID=A0A0G4F1U7_9ALVE|eukprot:Cvel_14658.t1-p1 / transcript=Cvel_14658.t1 / gene=Cvel_14658 / organism=Chromera_velia_CCMP2878 / gene_product=hypothetical protein / transcript_product=hypothetical protein / location=Cvel_scaffold1050:47960-50703(-) / protein_length=556 / sequence_SO=supercontig / SO=protein_coding / is_pseudo=false